MFLKTRRLKRAFDYGEIVFSRNFYLIFLFFLFFIISAIIIFHVVIFFFFI